MQVLGNHTLSKQTIYGDQYVQKNAYTSENEICAHHGWADARLNKLAEPCVHKLKTRFVHTMAEQMLGCKN